MYNNNRQQTKTLLRKVIYCEFNNNFVTHYVFSFFGFLFALANGIIFIVRNCCTNIAGIFPNGKIDEKTLLLLALHIV